MHVLFAALWLLAELARGVIFTGFPWVASGYAHVDSPLARLAPFVGVYGIGAIAALLTAWATLAALGGTGRARWRPALGAAALLLALALLAPAGFSRPAGTLEVVLLQGNVPQDEKFVPERISAAIDWHVRELLAARDAAADLVVAPETALVLLPAEMPPGFWDGLRQAFSAGRTHALFGVPMGDAADGYTNSAVGLGPGPADAAIYRYDKHHLVPFGEFIPPGFRWFTNLMNIPLGDFDRGPLVAPSMRVAGQRVAPNICYEDLFGEELAARFTDPAQAPTILANLSNIAWFGDTIAIDQHLQISRMRALELQRPDAARNQHRRDGRDRPQRAAAARRAGPAPGRAEGAGAGTRRHDTVCLVGRTGRPVAARPGRGGGAAARNATRATDARVGWRGARLTPPRH